jgi:hypothetical protein
MADETTASVIPLHQAPPKKKAKTPAKRAKPDRQRKRQKAKEVSAPDEIESLASDWLISPEFLASTSVVDEPSAPQAATAPPPTVPTSHSAERSAEHLAERLPEPVTRPRRQLAPVLLSVAALALAAVGITINGWFARSLGSSDMAGWLFLAIGVAADLVALVMPSCAAGLWQTGQRATALVGWAVWLMTFAFAVTAGIGFASTNISDVMLARASRVTPAVAAAQAELNDAMTARDRECKSGVGKFCREREAVVAERRQMLDTAIASVGRTADPQTEAAIKLVAWVSLGVLRPSADDFAMLRLVLLALLPQIGGILLMVGRSRAPQPTAPGDAVGAAGPLPGRGADRSLEPHLIG